MDVAPHGTLDAQPEPVPVPSAEEPGSSGPGRRSLLRDLPVLVLIAVTLTLLLRLLVVQAFYIPSGSMEPTLAVGDRVLVNKLSYRTGDVRRGDVVVFDGTDSFAAEVPPATTAPGLVGRLAGAVGGFLGIAPSEQDFVKRGDRVGGERVGGRRASGGLAGQRPPPAPPPPPARG